MFDRRVFLLSAALTACGSARDTGDEVMLAYVANDRDYPKQNLAMMRFLQDKPQEVWVVYSKYLNWDFALPTLHWMIDQPQCDLAVAAAILWLGDLVDPVVWLRADADSNPEIRLGKAIVRNEQRGAYARCAFRLPDDEMQAVADECRGDPYYEQLVPKGSKLYGPFGTRVAELPAEWDPGRNPVAWDLFEGLGTSWGARPT